MEDENLFEREFDVLMDKNGIAVSPDRKAGVLADYLALKQMTTLLRQPRSFESEPSNVYSLKTILNSIQGLSDEASS
jgi:hypothetical protein